jgi:hypothetical protein
VATGRPAASSLAMTFSFCVSIIFNPLSSVAGNQTNKASNKKNRDDDHLKTHFVVVVHFQSPSKFPAAAV